MFLCNYSYTIVKMLMSTTNTAHFILDTYNKFIILNFKFEFNLILTTF